MFSRAKLRKVRPPLAVIAPLTHKIVLGFIVFNAWIAYTIAVQVSLPDTIVHGIFNRVFWTVAFGLVATGLLVGVRLNDWTLIRWSMIVGLFEKAVWAYALAALAFQYGFDSVRGVLGLWLFAAWVQLVVVIYFTPNGHKHGIGSPSK